VVCDGHSSSSPTAAVVVTHPRPLGEVEGASNSSIIRRGPMVLVRGGIVSSTCIRLLNHILTFEALEPGKDARVEERSDSYVVNIEGRGLMSR